MTSTMVARGFSMGSRLDPGLRRPGPALRRQRLPVAAIVLSTLGHVLFFGGLAAVMMWGDWRPQKVQVVNLVPTVAAVGNPRAPAPDPSLPARPLAPVTPRAPQPDPEPRAPAAREAPRREAPSLPEPPRPAARLPARSAVARPGEKELPPLAAAPRTPSREQTGEVARPPETASRGAATGSVTGTGTLTLDVSDFPHAWYLRQVLQKVEEKWQRQNQAGEPPQKPLLLVEIQRDGSLAQIATIEKSSGNALYDQAALRAIMEASPFPPLPPDWTKPSLRVLFRFDLRRG